MHTRLPQMRKSAGLTQARLAARAGLHQQDISRWERGRIQPGISSLIKLAKALGVCVSQLVLGNRRQPMQEHGLSAQRLSSP